MDCVEAGFRALERAKVSANFHMPKTTVEEGATLGE